VKRGAALFALVLTASCTPGAIDDAGSSRRPALDSGPVDAGARDAGGGDSGAADSGPEDAGAMDSGPEDAGAVDSGSVDSGAVDAGSVDAGDGGALLVHCVSPDTPDVAGTATWTDSLGTASAAIDDRAACRRSYTLSSTAARRDDLPASPRAVVERSGWPTLRSGNDLFDALYALALEEVRDNSVDVVSDGAFNDGAGVECGATGSIGCFETGRLWRYVWTRDTAYAVDLGLAALDPSRARGSLEFKLSERRGGGDRQVVQDTGSGGSYPVSSDRTAWAMGAAALLPWLDGAERAAFGDLAYDALANTLEHDREVVFDPVDGLYRGEQSFLDWREQSYADYTADDVAPIAGGRALSTNLLHLRALEVTAQLADERGETSARDRYDGWADALRAQIDARFWLGGEGQFSTLIPGALDPAPVSRFDLLGSALAALSSVASDAQAQSVLSSYPHYGPGAPVLWPQQQATAIYHNRGEWPFVDAYWLRAAARAANDAVADRMVRALVRGAALNLSNMENFEAATGAPWLEEGATSGPVVNSQRQLWSVAGYASMVQHTIFGLHAESDGLHVQPFVTAGLRDSLFSGTDALVLNDFPWRGGTVTVVLHLPTTAGTGPLVVGERRLNGALLADDLLPPAALTSADRVDVTLLAGVAAPSTLTSVTDVDWRDVFGPRTPAITQLAQAAGGVTLTLATGGETAADVRFAIYRDGALVADDLPGSTTAWTDDGVDPQGARSPCWAVELVFASSGNHSQRSPAACWWGPAAARVTTIDASALVAVGGSFTNNHGRDHYEGWGDDGHSLTAPSFTAAQTGEHLLQVTYGNGAGPVDTGITCAVKRVIVEDTSDDSLVAEGVFVMPHLSTWDRWQDSSFVRAELVAGRTYRVIIASHADAVNMSSFEHFADYTGGLGGSSGVFNRVNIAELKILAR
jgi:hypothetical protein